MADDWDLRLGTYKNLKDTALYINHFLNPSRSVKLDEVHRLILYFKNWDYKKK